MKGIIISNVVGEEKQQTHEYIFLYFLSPIKAGLVGFSIFFTVLLIAKYVGFLINFSSAFNIQTDDVFLSLLGFVLLLLIKILENLNKRNKQIV